MKNQKRERGEGRIFQRKGSPYIWVQYNDRGRQVRQSSAVIIPSADLPEAEQRKAWLRAERFLRKRLGEVEAGIQPDNRAVRYEDLRDGYLDDLVLNARKCVRRNGEGEVYLEAVKRLNEFFIGYRAVEIDADVIRKFQKHEKQRGLANGTVNRSVASLSRMFTLAQRDGKLRHIPFFPKLPEAKPRKGTLPQEKFPALLAELPSYLRLVVTIGYRTGMRLSEILGLKWSNVDWLGRVIRLDDSKNGEAREIPFSDELESLLRAQFASRQPGCDFVCYRIDRKGTAARIGNFRKPWRRACVKVDLGKWEPKLAKDGQTMLAKPRYARSKPKPEMRYTGLIFHDLRRSFVTDAEHAGAPRHEVMAMTGHKTESVYKRYAISDRERRRAALAQVESFRSAKVQGQNGDNFTSHEAGTSVSS